MEGKYIELAIGAPSNRGTIVKIQDIPKYIKKAQLKKEQLFCSIFTFDEEIVEHFKIYKTVRSFVGKFYINNIIFDIDKGQNNDEFTLIRAKEFVNKLFDEWGLNSEQISVWFSGRGYHISTADFFHFEPDKKLPEIYRNTLTHYFPEADDKIYIRTGLIRVGNTLNIKTGLYKVNIKYEDFKNMTVQDILEWAKSPREIYKRENNVPDHSKYIIRLTNPSQQQQNVPTENEPTRIITCAQKIFLEGAKEGTRHANMVSMISVFRRQGIPYEGILTLVKDWNERGNSLEEYEIKKQTQYIWNKGYTPSCHDKILSKYCDPKCVHYKNKDLSVEIHTPKTLEIMFKEWAKSGITDNTFDFAAIYKLGKSHKIYPREFVYLQGDTGLGKSTLIMNWIINMPKYKTLFISNEVGEELFYRRAIQIANVMTKEEVINHYKNDNDANLTESIKHIDMMFQGTTFMDLKKKVAENDYSIVVVDVIDKMKVNKDDYNSKTDILAMELKNLAKTMNIIVIGVHHISKKAATQTRLDVHAGKGSSALEQAADQVFSIEGVRDNPTRYFRSEKTRDESVINLTLFYDTTTYTMQQLYQ